MVPLTIIIPTKDENETLKNLLHCLSLQTLKIFTIIVADCSSNNTVKNICRMHDIKCIPGGLPGTARNKGAILAKTENFLFLDADVSIAPDFIEQLIKIRRKENLECASFRFVADGKMRILKRLHIITSLYYSLKTKLGCSYGIGGAIFVTKKAHSSVGGFDETITIGEDIDYVQRITKKFKYKFLDNPHVVLNTRRFTKEGIIRTCFKHFLIELHLIFIGRIRHNRIRYL